MCMAKTWSALLFILISLVFFSGKLEEHLVLLAELVPKWMQILAVRKCKYVKLTKNYDINNVINTLLDHKKKAENT